MSVRLYTPLSISETGIMDGNNLTFWKNSTLKTQTPLPYELLKLQRLSCIVVKFYTMTHLTHTRSFYTIQKNKTQ